MKRTGQSIYRVPFVILLTTLNSLIADTDYALGEDHPLAAYFASESARLENAILEDIETLDDWNARKDDLRTDLLDMLGLWPFPERTSLKPEITGIVENRGFTVKKLHFQSLPNLYVTANLYIPANLEEPAPAILYVCGHAASEEDGISFGNKASYHHHAVWFAENGYVCLIIDTIHLGEIQGIHHGTYREGMWWWNARGYTPAGVETWNSIRAIDYLETLPEVDSDRIGMTGRSGGGGYAWWTAAVDERVAAAAPVAGITDLHNHVVDGMVEGHCDCMYILNTQQWDYPVVAALVAPRPLLIANTDRDHIHPLDGVLRLHKQTRRIYQLHGAEEQLGLLIAPGPHSDLQELQLPALRWFNRHFKGDNSAVTSAAEKRFSPNQLRVLEAIPQDAINARIHETFVPQAELPEEPPDTLSQWQVQMQRWQEKLLKRSFQAWPKLELHGAPQPQLLSTSNEARVFEAMLPVHPSLKLRFWLIQPNSLKEPAESTRIHVLDQSDPPITPNELAHRYPPSANEAVIVFPPRGIGPNGWPGDERRRTQIKRRFMLLGQTLEAMQVWDIRNLIRTIRRMESTAGSSIRLHAKGEMAVNALYATLFEEPLDSLTLNQPPESHRQGPHYLNVLRIMDTPQAMAMAAFRMPITLEGSDPHAWRYAQRLVDTFPESSGSLQFTAP